MALMKETADAVEKRDFYPVTPARCDIRVGIPPSPVGCHRVILGRAPDNILNTTYNYKMVAVF